MVLTNTAAVLKRAERLRRNMVFGLVFFIGVMVGVAVTVSLNNNY